MSCFQQLHGVLKKDKEKQSEETKETEPDSDSAEIWNHQTKNLNNYDFTLKGLM